MSVQPSAFSPVPESKAATARAAFRRPPLAVRLRDSFGALYAGTDFAALFPARGQPALPPWRLALETVLQFAEQFREAQKSTVCETRRSAAR